MSVLILQVEINHVTLKEWHDSIADISGSEHLVNSQVQHFPSIFMSAEKQVIMELHLSLSQTIVCSAGQHETETIQLERLYGPVPASSYLQSSC